MLKHQFYLYRKRNLTVYIWFIISCCFSSNPEFYDNCRFSPQLVSFLITSLPTLKRFFLFHFLFPFLLCGFRILHLFYLHFHSSNNPFRLNTNNKIPFFPFIFLKDFFGFILILCLYLLQTHFGISCFSHPDNALEVCGLLTPLHIVPEWYFLCQYAMLKAVPNKNAGFIILLTSIFTFFFFGEIRNLTTFTRLMDYNNGFSLSSFFLSLLSFLWIGAQFPQEKFRSYGRILTLHCDFLLMCTLFSKLNPDLKFWKSYCVLYLLLRSVLPAPSS